MKTLMRSLTAAMVHRSDNARSKQINPKPLRINHLRRQMVRLVRGVRVQQSQRGHPPNPKEVGASDAVQGVLKLL